MKKNVPTITANNKTIENTMLTIIHKEGRLFSEGLGEGKLAVLLGREREKNSAMMLKIAVKLKFLMTQS